MPKRKTRKRTSVNVPAKGVLRDAADRLWSLAVKEDWNNVCCICGHRGDLNSHHLIPRQHYSTRYELRNGCCLCRRCHQFCPSLSPHLNAAGFMHWLEQHVPAVHSWLMETVSDGRYRRFNGTTNPAYFCDTIRRLKEYVPEEDYVRIVGVKFSAWLENGKD